MQGDANRLPPLRVENPEIPPPLLPDADEEVAERANAGPRGDPLPLLPQQPTDSVHEPAEGPIVQEPPPDGGGPPAPSDELAELRSDLSSRLDVSIDMVPDRSSARPTTGGFVSHLMGGSIMLMPTGWVSRLVNPFALQACCCGLIDRVPKGNALPRITRSGSRPKRLLT